MIDFLEILGLKAVKIQLFLRVKTSERPPINRTKISHMWSFGRRHLLIIKLWRCPGTVAEE